jgi:hypothetical protein
MESITFSVLPDDILINVARYIKYLPTFSAYLTLCKKTRSLSGCMTYTGPIYDKIDLFLSLSDIRYINPCISKHIMFHSDWIANIKENSELIDKFSNVYINSKNNGATIHSFPKATYITCNYIPLDDQLDLSRLPFLHKLDLHRSRNCNIINIGSLKILDASCTYITDISVFRNLHTLNISHTSVSDVSPLCNLYSLNISLTQVTDVSALRNLHDLNISRTKVKDVSALGGLHTLYADCTPVSDVSMLGGLNTLYVRETDVEDVSALVNVPILNISQSKVRDVSMLVNVLCLYAAGLPISDVSTLRNVRRLDITNTNVNNVNMLTNVRDLTITYPTINDVSGLTHLRIINLSINKNMHIFGICRTVKPKLPHNDFVCTSNNTLNSSTWMTFKRR